MISTDQIQQFLAQDGAVVGDAGEKIGKAEQVFLDDVTGTPEWITVKTGMFGSSESFVPLNDASLLGDDLRVPFAKSKVKDAPRVDTDGHLSPEQEDELYAYYGMQYAASGTMSDTETRSTTDSAETHTHEARTEGHDTSGPNTDDAMTRSEEELHVGTERVEAGKAKLRKYVVTENVTTTVPVSREEVRLEREPITEANRGDALSGADITEEEHEVTLTQERPVVSKETVPVERVKLGTETVTDEQQVSESVRKEQIELDDSDGPNPRTTSKR